MLKNVHLAPGWLMQLEKKLHSLQPHACFRLFLTMEINPKVGQRAGGQGRTPLFCAVWALCVQMGVCGCVYTRAEVPGQPRGDRRRLLRCP